METVEQGRLPLSTSGQKTPSPTSTKQQLFRSLLIKYLSIKESFTEFNSGIWPDKTRTLASQKYLRKTPTAASCYATSRTRSPFKSKFLYNCSTLKWKESVDDTARFLDGNLLPCVLVENKIDLLEEDLLKDDSEMRKFAEDNKFDNHFRTSAKTGIGINECMDYLIKTILERSEKVVKEGEDPFNKDRKSLVLQHSKNGSGESQQGGGCC